MIIDPASDTTSAQRAAKTQQTKTMVRNMRGPHPLPNVKWLSTLFVRPCPENPWRREVMKERKPRQPVGFAAGTQPAPEPVKPRGGVLRRPHWRKMTWTLILANSLFLFWVIAATVDRPSKDCAPGDQVCIDASDVGTSIGVGLVIVLWFFVFVILALLWLMTRPKER